MWCVWNLMLWIKYLFIDWLKNNHIFVGLFWMCKSEKRKSEIECSDNNLWSLFQPDLTFDKWKENNSLFEKYSSSNFLSNQTVIFLQIYCFKYIQKTIVSEFTFVMFLCCPCIFEEFVYIRMSCLWMWRFLC